MGGATPEAIKEQLQRIEIKKYNTGSLLGFSPRAEAALSEAAANARTLNMKEMSVEELLIRIAKDNTGIGAEVLRRFDVNSHYLRSCFSKDSEI